MGLDGVLMFKVDELPVRRKTWVKIANVPRARLGWEFEDCKDVTDGDLQKVRSWIDQVSRGNIIQADGKRSCGKGLLIYGEPGNGKTTLALVVLQDMLRNLSMDAFAPQENKIIVNPCYFITFNDVVELRGSLMGDSKTDEMERLFLGMHGECADDAYNVRVLIVDDVGKEHMSASGWQRSVLHHLLRSRFNRGLPTIVTTNVKLDSWDTLYGSATESFAREAFSYLVLESTRGDLRR